MPRIFLRLSQNDRHFYPFINACFILKWSKIDAFNALVNTWVNLSKICLSEPRNGIFFSVEKATLKTFYLKR